MQLKQLLIVQQVCDRPRGRLPDQPYHSYMLLPNFGQGKES
ncbi:hypothetical protein ACOKW7_06585 [Limnospira platensis CENA597]|nr:hypothetical protein [Arthrospira platensis]MDT9185501.1 hypothetical protein [Limnospira sp. PMC 289.06]